MLLDYTSFDTNGKIWDFDIRSEREYNRITRPLAQTQTYIIYKHNIIFVVLFLNKL